VITQRRVLVLAMPFVHECSAILASPTVNDKKE
jgi:hypothetical protein